MMNKKNILVTGGAGYIGSHVCKVLAQANYVPICLDNFSNGHRELVKWGPLLEVDLRDKNLAARLKDLQFAAVIHFAARMEVGESVRSPLSFYDNNVGGALGLLGAIPEGTPIIFSSTAAVYGNPSSDRIPETTAPAPINPYGHGKRMVEDILGDLWTYRQWPSVVLRYFNVAGCDPDGETGEWHEPESHLIPLLLAAAMTPEGNVQIFGDDYPTPDGTCLRDYVHVMDLAEAHVRALEFVLKEPRHDRFNIGYSRGRSVREVLAAVERVCGRKLSAHVRPRRAGDPASLVADASRAQAVLQWQPRYGDKLDEMIRHAWEWQKKLPSVK